MDVHELPGRSGYQGDWKRTQATTLISLIAACAPLLYSYFILLFPSSLLVSRPFSSHPLSFLHSLDLWMTQGATGNSVLLAEEPSGRVHGDQSTESMYKRSSQLPWVIFTVQAHTINVSCLLWGTTSSQLLRRANHHRDWWKLDSLPLVSLLVGSAAKILRLVLTVLQSVDSRHSQQFESRHG